MAKGKYFSTFGTKAHPICILRKLREKGLPYSEANVKKVAEECIAEGKYHPIIKFLIELGLRKP